MSESRLVKIMDSVSWITLYVILSIGPVIDKLPIPHIKRSQPNVKKSE